MLQLLQVSFWYIFTQWPVRRRETAGEETETAGEDMEMAGEETETAGEDMEMAGEETETAGEDMAGEDTERDSEETGLGRRGDGNGR